MDMTTTCSVLLLIEDQHENCAANSPDVYDLYSNTRQVVLQCSPLATQDGNVPQWLLHYENLLVYDLI